MDFQATWKTQIETLKQKWGSAIVEVRMPPERNTNAPILYIQKESLIPILQFLKTESGFEYNFLSDITATDETHEPRFEVVYNLFSTLHHYRIRLKLCVKDGEGVPTATSVWAAANWAEREVWDMFGIRFSGHPNLRRILMDYRWQGHPLRKDYPLRGYQIFPTPEPIDPERLK